MPRPHESLLDHEIAFQRLDAFLDGFPPKAALQRRMYGPTAPVGIAVYSVPDLARPPYAAAVCGDFVPAQLGDTFGPTFSTHWFRLEATIPAAWEGSEVHLLFDCGGEALVYENDTPQQGLVGEKHSMRRVAYRLAKEAPAGGRAVVLYVEFAANYRQDLDWAEPQRERYFPLEQCELAVFNRACWDLAHDFTVIRDMAKHLGTHHPRGAHALFVANKMINQIDVDNEATWAAARETAAAFLSVANGGGQVTYRCTASSHLDLAWGWPLAETRRKAARTLSSAMRLMEDYPDFVFGFSQSVVFDWLREDYPSIYGDVVERGQEGRFVGMGGTYVEPDCNIPSGESLVRQFLVGQRGFEEHFGKRCREFWLPDTFGYAAQLPAIMKSCGCDYFLTTKLSWNTVNRMPHDMFYWEALDSSRVMSYFPPGSIASLGTVKDILDAYNNKDLERSRNSLMLCGHGDGGGGVQAEMLEQLVRCQDTDGLPKIKFDSPEAFFVAAEAEAEDLTRWVGELYLEKHRATYTTVAKIKQSNRLCEILLHDVEFLSAMAAVRRDSFPYPRAELDRVWKIVLLNQFHDILPGTSIQEVHDEAMEDYAEAIEAGYSLYTSAMSALLGTPGPAAEAPQRAPLLVVNTTGFARREVVEYSGDLSAGATRRQRAAKGAAELVEVEAPAYGFQVVEAGSGAAAATARGRQDGDDLVLENDDLVVEFNTAGEITRFFDKTHEREVLEPGAVGNKLRLFDDCPPSYDAWDVEIYHMEKEYAIKSATATLLEEGPLRAAIEVVVELTDKSTLTQTISLAAGARRLEVRCEADWHDFHRFLKAEFPLNVKSLQATYEVQFGHLSRPTHYNTPWDAAKFEVCGHRWADLSEYDYGVAILNDCKYGYSCRDNVMRISLVRGAALPDETADQGAHKFAYAVYPHKGSFQEGGVVQEGMAFNYPLHVQATPDPQIPTTSYFAVDHPSVVLDTVKMAEDSNALIVRLYEAFGGRRTVTLTMDGLAVASVKAVNMLEDDDPDTPTLPLSNSQVSLSFKPHEIKTFKVVLE